MNDFKEIYRDECKSMCQTVGMDENGVFEIRYKFKEEYGGGEYIAYVSSVEVRAMMKALEELRNEKEANL